MSVELQIGQLKKSCQPSLAILLNSFADSSTDFYKVTVLCPISKTRIVTPVRSPECKHLQCFDAESYHHLNKDIPKWKCPLCSVAAPFSSLVVDLYFVEILGSEDLPETSTDVIFKRDGGGWTPDLKPVDPPCIDLTEIEIGNEVQPIIPNRGPRAKSPKRKGTRRRKMRIFVKPPTNMKVFPLYVHSTDYIHDVKVKIQSLTGISYCKIRLNFCGMNLCDDHTLSDCGVKLFSTLKLSV